MAYVSPVGNGVKMATNGLTSSTVQAAEGYCFYACQVRHIMFIIISAIVTRSSGNYLHIFSIRSRAKEVRCTSWSVAGGGADWKSSL